MNTRHVSRRYYLISSVEVEISFRVFGQQTFHILTVGILQMTDRSKFSDSFNRISSFRTIMLLKPFQRYAV